MPQEPDKVVKSVVRSMSILELIAKSSDPLGVTEISKELDIHKSTVHRLLETMKYLGYISQNESTGKYSTGLKLFEIGSLAIDDLDLNKTVEPYLEDLMKETGETIHLAVLDSGEIVYTGKVESQKTIRMYSKIGKRVFAHSTSLGKVILAYSSQEKKKEIIRNKGLPKQTDNTIDEKEEFFQHLDTVKEQGYAIDDEENEVGIRCIAGPIFNHKGETIAAFSISGPATRMTTEKINEYTDLVCDYSQRISHALGYNGS